VCNASALATLIIRAEAPSPSTSHCESETCAKIRELSMLLCFSLNLQKNNLLQMNKLFFCICTLVIPLLCLFFNNAIIRGFSPVDAAPKVAREVLTSQCFKEARLSSLVWNSPFNEDAVSLFFGRKTLAQVPRFHKYSLLGAPV